MIFWLNIYFQHVTSCLFWESFYHTRENHFNYFSVYCGAVPLIQTPSNKHTHTPHAHTQTDTHRHISDIDIVYFPILITYHVCAVGGISWMSMSMCETSWHLQHLQGQYLNQHYTSVSVDPSRLFLKADPWHSRTVCFCQSNKSPLNQCYHTNLPLIHLVDIGESALMIFYLESFKDVMFILYRLQIHLYNVC